MAKYKLGLALSGGGIRGACHLGVLKALEEIGLKPDCVSGVSVGAIVGALYSDGQPLDVCLKFFENSKLTKSVKLNMPKNGGLANTDSFRKQITDILNARTFSELKIPLVINATNLNSGKVKYFKSGELIDAVVASASVPVLFNPVKIGDDYYVDGGIMSNLPAEVIRKDCDMVIGVHVNPIWPMDGQMGLKTVAERVFHLAVNGNTFREKSFCDLVIDMKADQDVGMFQSSMAEYLMEVGYRTAMKAFKKTDFTKYGLNVNIF